MLWQVADYSDLHGTRLIHVLGFVPQNPPPAVKLVMESVCVMLSIKSERKPDPAGMGKVIEDYWGPSQKLLGDMKFLERLKTYDKDNIPPAVMKRIREKSVTQWLVCVRVDGGGGGGG